MFFWKTALECFRLAGDFDALTLRPLSECERRWVGCEAWRSCSPRQARVVMGSSICARLVRILYLWTSKPSRVSRQSDHAPDIELLTLPVPNSKFVRKSRLLDTERVQVRLESAPREDSVRELRIRRVTQDYDGDGEPLSRLLEQDLLYRRLDNSACRTLRGVQYFASCFLSLAQLKGGTPVRQLLPGGSVRAEEGPWFQSQFESGNLHMALRRGPNEYDLLLQNDLNSRGYTQWFYFAVSRVSAGTTIRLNLVNLVKSDSLFNHGMLPAVHSAKSERGWQRAGFAVKYQKNEFRREHCDRNYYTLSFSYTFKHEQDTVSFAHSYPYTLTALKNYLQGFVDHPIRSKFARRQALCKSLGGQTVECVVVGQGEGWEKRKAIVVLGRQHPGQTPSSFAVQGFLEFIGGKSKEAQFLRKHYQIRVVPMLNVDGVVCGNYRCTLAGCDPNRKWLHTDRKTLPEVYAVRKMIAELGKEKRLRFLLDFHGHSRKLRSFFFCNSGPPQLTRLFPFLCSKINPDIHFQSSTYTSPTEKKSTARVSCSEAFGPQNVATFEVSFYGTMRDRLVRHFTEDDMRVLGQSVGNGLYYYTLADWDLKKGPEHSFLSKAKKQLRGFDFPQATENDSGSDSEPEIDSFQPEDLALVQPSSNQSKQLDPITVLERHLTQHSNSNRRPQKMTGKKFTVRAISGSKGKNMRFMELGKVDSAAPNQRQLALEPLNSKFSPQRQRLQLQNLRRGLFQDRQVGKPQLRGKGLSAGSPLLLAAIQRTISSKQNLIPQ